jgi:hypothetical protein
MDVDSETDQAPEADYRQEGEASLVVARDAGCTNTPVSSRGCSSLRGLQHRDHCFLKHLKIGTSSRLVALKM